MLSRMWSPMAPFYGGPLGVHGVGEDLPGVLQDGIPLDLAEHPSLGGERLAATTTGKVNNSRASAANAAEARSRAVEAAVPVVRVGDRVVLWSAEKNVRLQLAEGCEGGVDR